MSPAAVDLSAHINKDIQRGHGADFPVGLRSISVVPLDSEEMSHPIPNRKAVFREDTGDVLAVVSNRYSLVRHQQILDSVEEAIRPMDVGPVPRGIYVDRNGARMRALFKFPSIRKPVTEGDEICPCLKIENTYDGTSRITIHIGAFRFVCTNLAVGGGGVFAGGFMSIHAGEIPLNDVGQELRSYLARFGAIVRLYRFWRSEPLSWDTLEKLLSEMAIRPAELIGRELAARKSSTVYDAYNIATRYATHEMRSARSAFDLLRRINHTFQGRFPIPEA